MRLALWFDFKDTGSGLCKSLFDFFLICSFLSICLIGACLGASFVWLPVVTWQPLGHSSTRFKGTVVLPLDGYGTATQQLVW